MGDNFWCPKELRNSRTLYHTVHVQSRHADIVESGSCNSIAIGCRDGVICPKINIIVSAIKLLMELEFFCCC